MSTEEIMRTPSLDDDNVEYQLFRQSPVMLSQQVDKEQEHSHLQSGPANTPQERITLPTK